MNPSSRFSVTVMNWMLQRGRIKEEDISYLHFIIYYVSPCFVARGSNCLLLLSSHE